MFNTLWREFTKKRKVWIGISGVKHPTIAHYLFLLVILLGGYYFFITSDERYETGNLNQHYKGIIIKKYEDNDGAFIYLKDKKGRVPLYHNTTFYLLEEDDSVIKEQNSYNIKVFRGDSIFYLNNKTGEGKYKK